MTEYALLATNYPMMGDPWDWFPQKWDALLNRLWDVRSVLSIKPTAEMVQSSEQSRNREPRRIEWGMEQDEGLVICRLVGGPFDGNLQHMPKDCTVRTATIHDGPDKGKRYVYRGDTTSRVFTYEVAFHGG